MATQAQQAEGFAAQAAELFEKAKAGAALLDAPTVGPLGKASDAERALRMRLALEFGGPAGALAIAMHTYPLFRDSLESPPPDEAIAVPQHIPLATAGQVIGAMCVLATHLDRDVYKPMSPGVSFRVTPNTEPAAAEAQYAATQMPAQRTGAGW